MPVTVIEFPSTHDESYWWFAYSVGLHDEESNKFKKTDVGDMVALANKFRDRTGSNSWADTAAALNAYYGKGKRIFVYRAVLCAQTLHASWLVEFRKNHIPNKWVYENPFFTAPEGRKRLSERAGLAALEWIADARDESTHRNFNSEKFQKEYCAPAQAVLKWEIALTNDYGGLCKNPAVQRCINFLWQGRLRINVLACLNAGVPLHGTGNAENKLCVEMCACVVSDLRAALQLSAGPAGTEAGKLGATAASTAPGATPCIADMTGSGGGGISIADVDEEVDPAKLATEQKMAVGLLKFTFHRKSATEFTNDLASSLLTSRPLWVVVDAPTSKSKVILNLLEVAAKAILGVGATKFRIIVFCGRRLEVIGAVNLKAAPLFPASINVPITLTTNTQAWWCHKPSYMLTVLSPDVKDSAAFQNSVPLTVEALSAKAHAYEQCRRRCVDVNCKFRPVKDQEKLASVVAMATPATNYELERDDTEDTGIDENVQDVAADDGAQDVAFVPPTDCAKHPVCLDWCPIHLPKDFYLRVFRAVTPQEPITQIIALTTTAAPGLLFAAHELGAEMHMFYDRVTDHSFEHGQEIFKQGPRAALC